MNGQRLAGLLLLGMALAAAGHATAEIFRWTDEKGKVHFSDREPVRHKAETIEVRVNTYESVSYDTSLVDTGRQVVMYSASWCGYCKKARRYFEEQRIAFTEHDIEKDATARRAYQKMGARGVPVILVGRKRMNGFSVAGFEKLYR